MNKICSKCKQEKPLEEFAKDSRGKYGKRSDCKICNCLTVMKYQKSHSESVAIKNKEWRIKNKKHLKDWQQQYAPRKKFLVKQRYHKDIKFRNNCIQQSKNYRDNPKNKKIINAGRRKLIARYRKNPAWRMKLNLRRRMIFALKGERKSECSQRLVGCGWQELRKHIESKFLPGMTWGNYGIKGWHVDHIIPCSTFDLSKPQEQRKCFHYSNLQPLWAKDNLKKSDNFKI